MSKFIILVGGLAIFLAHRFRTVPSPIVTIDDGLLQGRIGHSRDGNKEIYEYLSIPFAEPPVGELRFEAPVPIQKSWPGIKQVTSYSPFCLQMDSLMRGKMYGEEDCLYLNVFTRGLEGKRPVMVYIHGGGFFIGAANMYHPEYFMDEDIVLVTINYRLGALGFMNLEDGLIRGNMGLKDQNLALKWVQQNIARFGGDPTSITLFGESAGAASVAYHMISPASKGLFHRAILQSGSVTCPWAFRHDPKPTANHFIENTKCSNEKGKDLVKCLKQMDAKDLVKQSLRMMDPTYPLHIFVPTVETVVTEDTFLTENPRKTLKSGKLANNVPVMLGVTSGEGALRTARFEAMPEVIPTVDQKWDEMVARVLLFDDADIPAKTAQELRKKYFGSGAFPDNFHEFNKKFTLMASDMLFFAPVRSAAMSHAKLGATTYMYYYDYDVSSLPNLYSFFRAVRADDWIYPDLKLAYAAFTDLAKKKWYKSEGPHDFGITHGDDLLTLWNMEGWTKFLSGGDTQFSKAFVKAFVDFAYNEGPLKFDGVEWPTVKSEQAASSPKYMLISKQPKVIEEPFTDGVRFWEKLNIRE